MRIAKIIIGNAFMKILDTALLLGVILCCYFVFPLRDHNDFLKWFESIYGVHIILLFFVASLAIGTVQVIIKVNCKKDDMKTENETQNTSIAIKGVCCLLEIAILHVIITNIFHVDQEIVTFCDIFIASIALQKFFWGRKSLLGIIVFGIKKLLSAFSDLIYLIEEAIIAFCDIIGIRLFTALVEILLTIGLTAIACYVFNLLQIPLLETFKEMEYVQLGQILKEFNIDIYSGLFSWLAGIEISGDVVTILFALPFGCATTGFLCFFIGVGWIAVISRKIMGWENRLCEKWDEKVSERWDRDTQMYTNDNPFPLIIIISFLVIAPLNAALGVFMPLYIIVNIVVGTIQLVKGDV